MSKRLLIFIPGACPQQVGCSDRLWAAIAPHTDVYGDGDLGVNRFEILWEDLITNISMGGLDLPLCFADFFQYLNDMGTRLKIINRIIAGIRSVFSVNAAVDIYAHSEGTIGAYEALRYFDDYPPFGEIVNFFTMGAALGFAWNKLVPTSNVRDRLLPANMDGAKPKVCQHWFNLCTQGDPFGAALKPAYDVDEDFVNLPALGCSPVQFLCSHDSYFDPQNLAICRDILAAKANA